MQSDLISLEATLGHGHVLIELIVMIKLAAYRQDKKPKPEAGGILLGYRRDPHIHVVDATVPGSGDRALRTHFWRSADSHQRIARERWLSSGHILDYVGEWHTHPQTSPSPSTIDIGEWRKISTLSGEEQMLFLILGMEQHDWLGISQGAELRKLNLSPIDAPSFAVNMQDELKEMS